MEKKNLLDLTYPELEATLRQMNYPRFRAKQLANWIYKNLEFDLDNMGNLPNELKEKLENNFTTAIPTIEHISLSASDNSYKFLLKTTDNKQIESILMLEETPGSRKRATICVSCMIGCPLGCKFCATGSEIGFVRKLSPAEIVGQVLAILRYAKQENLTQKITNIVFMGMGEPFLNEDSVRKAIALLTDKDCFELSPAKIAVSTAGVGPGIAQFINETQVRLAVSLHFPTDDLRLQYMPVNKHFPIKALIEELKQINLKKRDYILIEYLMLDGINDQLVHAKQLQKLVCHLKVKINLIPYNPVKHLKAKPSNTKAIDAFATYLKDKGIFVSVRHSKGVDIEGGCGQFALKEGDS